uniref:Uncharacterized protein n=1 Tax=Myotis myotis TaxID=51298 RepID=A0A7J7UCQ9_MYOMY|nr:hypothetical protein mMyoMyo1_008767 [Myotis myotis]
MEFKGKGPHWTHEGDPGTAPSKQPPTANATGALQWEANPKTGRRNSPWTCVPHTRPFKICLPLQSHLLLLHLLGKDSGIRKMVKSLGSVIGCLGANLCPTSYEPLSLAKSLNHSPALSSVTWG